MSENPYQLSDQAAQLLNRKAVKRFEEARRKCALLDFDELNVIKIIRDLYRDLAGDNREAFEDLAEMVYDEMELEDEEDELMVLWLLSEVLDQPNPVTGYIYTNEVERKRDRAAESVNASAKKRQEFHKALRLWSRMTMQYADLVTDGARLKAFRDAGVKFVKWNSEKDEKVCEKCRARDGKIYPIDKAPSKEHPNCRCYYTAVIEK